MHFCTKTQKRVHVFCANNLTEGAGSRNPCFQCEPPPFTNCSCDICQDATSDKLNRKDVDNEVSIKANDITAYEPNNKRNVLCMGMFFAHKEYVTKLSSAPEGGQGLRDRLRCLKLEEDFTVYTVDDKHDPSKAEKDRHYGGKFNLSSFPRELMSTLPIRGEIYLVLFDLYFILQGSYLQERWRSPLYTDVIPGTFVFYSCKIPFDNFILFSRIVSVPVS